MIKCNLNEFRFNSWNFVLKIIGSVKQFKPSQIKIHYSLSRIQNQLQPGERIMQNHSIKSIQYVDVALVFVMVYNSIILYSQSQSQSQLGVATEMQSYIQGQKIDQYFIRIHLKLDCQYLYITFIKKKRKYIFILLLFVYSCICILYEDLYGYSNRYAPH